MVVDLPEEILKICCANQLLTILFIRQLLIAAYTTSGA